jgi:hypothetical protein
VEPAKGYHSTDANTLDMLERGEPQTVVWRKLDHGPGFRFPQGRYADWTIGRIRRDAALIGPATAARCGGTVATVVEPPRNAPCRVTPLTPVERPPPGKPGPSTPLLPKRKPRRGKRGFQQRTALGRSGGTLGAVLQALVARASGGVQSGSGRGRAGRDGHGPVRSSALGSQSKVFASFDYSSC